MKKIIGIVFISLMFANIGSAEIRGIEGKRFEGASGVSTICVDGYKFVTSEDLEATSIVQFFEERDGKSLPAKC